MIRFLVINKIHLLDIDAGAEPPPRGLEPTAALVEDVRESRSIHHPVNIPAAQRTRCRPGSRHMAAGRRVVHSRNACGVHQHIALYRFEQGHIIGEQAHLVGDGSLGLGHAKQLQHSAEHLHPILPHGGTNPLVRLESTHEGLDIVRIRKAGPIRWGVGEGYRLAERPPLLGHILNVANGLTGCLFPFGILGRLGNTGGSGTVPFWIDVAASGTAGNAITWTNAFQIDSSQNATFAGNVVLGAGKRVAYSASAYMTPENNVDGAEIASPGQFTVKTASTQALKIDSSQNATFAGGIIGMTQGNVDNISDDGVASFTPLYNRGFIVINNPDYSQNALIAYFKAGSSYLLYSITKSADVTLNNSTTLTGTTGTDGKLNIGYNNSIIYIENRLGGIGNFQRYALGGTNN